MIVLYRFATSPFTEKVRRALRYKGLEFVESNVPRDRVAELAHISPTGKFPAIEDGAVAICDSTDIIRHLDRRYRTKPLIPGDARQAGLAHALEEWADESLYFYEMAVRLTWEHNLERAMPEFEREFPGVPTEQLKTRIMEGAGNLVRTQGLGRKSRSQVMSDLLRHFEALDGLLETSEWLAGPVISVADLAVLAQLNAMLYADEARAMLEASKNIKAWMARTNAVAPNEAGEVA